MMLICDFPSFGKIYYPKDILTMIPQESNRQMKIRLKTPCGGAVWTLTYFHLSCYTADRLNLQ